MGQRFTHKHWICRSALVWVSAAALFAFSLASPIAAQGGQQSGKLGLSPIDVVSLSYVVEVYPSPDGSQIAFTRLSPRLADAEPGPDNIHLCIVAADGGDVRTLLGGTRRVSGVNWSPDGNSICFLHKGDGDDATQVYSLPMAGGEPTRLTNVERGVSSYSFRPNSPQELAFVSTNETPATDEKATKLGFKQLVYEEQFNNSSLYLYNIESGKSTQLTTDGHVNSFVWSADGSNIAAAISPRSLVDDTYMFQRMHLVNVDSKSVRSLWQNPGKIGHYDFSPDGNTLAIISAVDVQDPHAGNLFAINIANGQANLLTDGFRGMVHDFQWTSNDRIRACISKGVHNTLATLNTDSGSWAEESPIGPAFASFKRLAGDGNGYAVAGSTPTHPAEVFTYLRGEWKRLTNSNPQLGDFALGRQTVETITARDGLKFEGLLMWPAGYEEGKRYPMIIVAHGGPESHFSNGWNTNYSNWGQMAAGKGYFAWYPNYRASTGYGVEFAKADHGDPMGAQFNDHLDAIAAFDARGLIDPKRVGVGGGSYGGYTAAWAATKETQHFACAVSFVPVIEVHTKWLTSDIPWEFYYVHYQEKLPHEALELLRERSPLTYATQCDTPLLILGGTADTRINSSQPFMLYRAVKFATDTPVRYVQYPGEGHGNRMNVYRYDYAVRTMRWFDKYLAEGDHRDDLPPGYALDLSAWEETDK